MLTCVCVFKTLNTQRKCKHAFEYQLAHRFTHYIALFGHVLALNISKNCRHIFCLSLPTTLSLNHKYNHSFDWFLFPSLYFVYTKILPIPPTIAQYSSERARIRHTSVLQHKAFSCLTFCPPLLATRVHTLSHIWPELLLTTFYTHTHTLKPQSASIRQHHTSVVTLTVCHSFLWNFSLHFS